MLHTVLYIILAHCAHHRAWGASSEFIKSYSKAFLADCHYNSRYKSFRNVGQTFICRGNRDLILIILLDM